MAFGLGGGIDALERMTELHVEIVRNNADDPSILGKEACVVPDGTCGDLELGERVDSWH